ncbi:MAG: GNAT family N-acetyltransferase [Gemmatimonadetes bacterium]|nr:GNAT family N-acetyltransferase [Gemmatimonadota bacterium]NNF13415.1 GNAT family N-acetyltransferase [Gemmatimonadota bacterium]
MADRPSLPKTLRTERLLLRPFQFGDVDDVYAYAKDPEWSRFLRVLPRPYDRIHAEQFIARQTLLDWIEHVAWAAVLKDRVVGGIGLRFNFENRHAELGYSIARSEWGNGYCTEAARAVIDAAFRTHEDLIRVHARADENNTSSQRVMQKTGMTKEGVLRKFRVERGEAFDEAWHSILREEWKQ